MQRKYLTTRLLDWFEEGVMAGGVIYISGLLLWSIIGREISRSPFSTEEQSYLLMILITFFGVSYATRKGRHIRMTALIEKAPCNIRKAMIFFEVIIGILLMTAFCYASVSYSLWLVEKERYTVVLHWPYWILSMWLILGFGMSSVHYLRLLIRNITSRGIWLSPEKMNDAT